MPVNLMSNPTAGADAAGVASTQRAATRVAAAGASGTGFFRGTSQSGDVNSLLLQTASGVIPGLPYSASVSVGSPNITGRFVNASLGWRDAGGVFLGSTTADAVALTNGWTRLVIANVIAPAGAATAFVQGVVRTDASGATAYTPAVGDLFDADSFLLVQSATAPEYFDGDSPGAAWMGTPHASASVLMVPALTAFTDAPRVEVVFDVLPPAAAMATIRATIAGRTSEVRGAIRTSVSGALNRTDFEAPDGVPVTYRAELFNAAGVSIGFTSDATITVPASDFDGAFHYVWLHSPTDPSTAVRVAWGRDALSRISTQSPGSVEWAQGRRLGLALSSRRTGMIAVPMDVVTDTLEDAAKVDALFGGPQRARQPVVCVRMSPSLAITRLPAVWFAGILEQSYEPDMTMGSERTVWRLRGDEVAPPVPAIVIPLLRRKDIAAFYATRQAVRNDNQSRFALSRRYELAGLGGA